MNGASRLATVASGAVPAVASCLWATSSTVHTTLTTATRQSARSGEVTSTCCNSHSTGSTTTSAARAAPSAGVASATESKSATEPWSTSSPGSANGAKTSAPRRSSSPTRNSRARCCTRCSPLVSPDDPARSPDSARGTASGFSASAHTGGPAWVIRASSRPWAGTGSKPGATSARPAASTRRVTDSGRRCTGAARTRSARAVSSSLVAGLAGTLLAAWWVRECWMAPNESAAGRAARAV
mmetsp:Transcript_11445/g.28957  ORF Transcript_11445/g.28957 Transcript_11445/m.28957 type:complete len:240 (-) Transcript_11445:332-1051(-)